MLSKKRPGGSTMINRRICVLFISALLVGCVPEAQHQATLDELKATKERVVILEQALELVKSRLAIKPEMPIKISFRRAIMGPGAVAKIETTVKKTVLVKVTVDDSVLGYKKEFKLSIDPTLGVEIGHAEGVPITDGDIITVFNSDYEPLVITYTR